MTMADFKFVDIKSARIVIGPVSIYPDGRVELAEGVSADEASMQFWKILNDAFPNFLEVTKAAQSK